MSKAILLSGGMDSISLAYWKRPSIAITIDYGQMAAETEIRTSKIVAETLQMQHHIVKVDCSSLGTGDLLNRKSLEISPSPEWWPYRNQLLVTLGIMKGIKLGISEIMVASVKSDGFHRDGTNEFYETINKLTTYQEGSIAVTAPCITLGTLDLIKVSKVPKSILFWAHSCHKENVACGTCRGCLKYSLVMNKLFYAE